jgi:hypothetical protein
MTYAISTKEAIRRRVTCVPIRMVTEYIKTPSHKKMFLVLEARFLYYFYCKHRL